MLLYNNLIKCSFSNHRPGFLLSLTLQVCHRYHVCEISLAKMTSHSLVSLLKVITERNVKIKFNFWPNFIIILFIHILPLLYHFLSRNDSCYLNKYEDFDRTLNSVVVQRKHWHQKITFREIDAGIVSLIMFL